MAEDEAQKQEAERRKMLDRVEEASRKAALAVEERRLMGEIKPSPTVAQKPVERLQNLPRSTYEMLLQVDVPDWRPSELEEKVKLAGLSDKSTPILLTVRWLDVVRSAAGEALDALKERLAEAEATIAALAERLAAAEMRGLDYRGVWQKADSYRRGDAVTYDGSLWIALQSVEADKPGASDAWQLAAKRGRDGKDVR